jgi:hypothetical protein
LAKAWRRHAFSEIDVKIRIKKIYGIDDLKLLTAAQVKEFLDRDHDRPHTN